MMGGLRQTGLMPPAGARTVGLECDGGGGILPQRHQTKWHSKLVECLAIFHLYKEHPSVRQAQINTLEKRS